MDNPHPARVRFAPSPTGRLHLGGARTALYDYLVAQQTGGQFILRVEDTDRKRYDPESEQDILDGLRWLGLRWDEGPDIGGPHAPYYQSQRKEIYQAYANQLVETGHAYYCFCTPQRLSELRRAQRKQKRTVHYDGMCRLIPGAERKARVAAGEPYVVRFKTPREGSITITDRLRGDIRVENKNLDDYILVKSDGLAVYHLAAMVDDHLMEITHVIRAAEWLPTFPLHVHIYQAFGWEQPEWVHPSLFLKPSGKGKMSKREAAEFLKGGHSIYIQDLKDMGYLPEAVINWIVLMGWSYDDRTEFFTLPELIEKFSIDRLSPSPAAINFSKFDHFNGLHIRHLSEADLASRLVPFYQAASYNVTEDQVLEIVPLIQQRLVTLEDAPMISGFFFENQVTPIPEELVGKNLTAAESCQALQRAYQVLKSLPDMDPGTTEAPMRELADELGINAGQLFGILRVAVTGQRVSPPLFESMLIIGRDKVLVRTENALQILDRMLNSNE